MVKEKKQVKNAFDPLYIICSIEFLLESNQHEL